MESNAKEIYQILFEPISGMHRSVYTGFLPEMNTLKTNFFHKWTNIGKNVRVESQVKWCPIHLLGIT